MNNTTRKNRQGEPEPKSRSATLSLVAFDDISDAVRVAVAEVLEDFKATDPDTLLTQAQLAQRIQVSVATVRQLRDRGMPTVMVLESPRFDWAAVKAWLVDNGKTAGSNAVSKSACPNLHGSRVNLDDPTVGCNLRQVAGADLDVEAAQ